MRSWIDVASSVSVLDHHVHLNAAARAELCWWGSFLQLWNWGSHHVAKATQLCTDASGAGAAEHSARTGGSSWSGRASGQTRLSLLKS